MPYLINVYILLVFYIPVDTNDELFPADNGAFL